jgi:hypothetical protein
VAARWRTGARPLPLPPWLSVGCQGAMSVEEARREHGRRHAAMLVGDGGRGAGVKAPGNRASLFELVVARICWGRREGRRELEEGNDDGAVDSWPALMDAPPQA